MYFLLKDKEMPINFENKGFAPPELPSAPSKSNGFDELGSGSPLI
jgi:hypothetical protein